MAKRANGRPARIPKARTLRRSSLQRVDVTRAEYNEIIDLLNERNLILNALREAIERLERADHVQFARTAQLQADIDLLKRALERPKAS
jgi:hypothetical protein